MFQKKRECFSEEIVSAEEEACFRRILLKHLNVSEERPPANIDALSALNMFSLPLNSTVNADILFKATYIIKFLAARTGGKVYHATAHAGSFIDSVPVCSRTDCRLPVWYYVVQYNK
jgi:hypothetical protein